MIKRENTSIRHNQQGLVAIVVTFIIMLLLTLIVTGFAQLARREQREALDRQLATQALYAAEAGINEGRSILYANRANPSFEKTDCKPDAATPNAQVLDKDTTLRTFEFSCLLIDKTPPELVFQTVAQNKSTVTPIVPVSTSTPPSIFSKLVIAWQNSSGPVTIGSSTDGYNFGKSGSTWNTATTKPVGMLRVELVPNFENSGPLTLQQIREGTFVVYLLPRATTDSDVPVESVAYEGYGTNPQAQGKVVKARCNGAESRACHAVITGLSGSYFLRVKALYNDADVRICPGGTLTALCDPNITLSGSQAEIDSTGRANDVLKRIKVRTNLRPDYDGSVEVGEYTVESSESLCKLYKVWPGGAEDDLCVPPAP